MNRLLTLLFALGLFAGPTFGEPANGPARTAAEPAAEPVVEYTFRFVADDDMFYVPWNGNGEELDRLLACIAQHKAAILDGEIPVEVNGYSTSQATAAENRAMAKTRSNRVKTEMILRGGLTEACFTTKNHASEGNFVTVRIVIPAAEQPQPEPEAEKPAETATAEAERRAAAQQAGQTEPAEPQPTETRPAEPAEPLPPVLEEPTPEAAEAAGTATATATAPAGATAKSDLSGLALRANLLRWATLTPDLGLEWRIDSRWSVGVNGSWTSWTWNGVERTYALWEVAPEVRYYLGSRKRGYLGVMFKAGQFNYKLSDTGRQGDLVGGGITGGYTLPVGRRLALDFSLGLGCLHADFEKYEAVEGVRVRQGSETKNWWGPVNAGITLTWNLF